jgi:dihydrofolate reductase
VLSSLREAVQHCAGHEKIFICGGAAIYREALALVDKIELTVIHRQCGGDDFFPEIDSAQWTKTGAVDFDEFSFISYSRNHEGSNFSSACGGHGESIRRP